MERLSELLYKMDDSKKQELNENEKFKEYLESFGIDSNLELINMFKISFSVNESGIVDVAIDWPEKGGDEIISMSGTLLFSLNSGLLKNLILDAITDSSKKYPELTQDVQKVVESWLELQNSSSDSPCISPTDTLKNV